MEARPSGYELADAQIGDTITNYELPVTLTDTTFEVRVPPGSIPATYVGDGVVNVTVNAVSPDGSVATKDASARIVPNAAWSKSWVAPNTVAPGARVSTASTAGVSVGTLVDLGRPPASASRIGSRTAAASCQDEIINRHRPLARVAASFPYGSSASWLAVDHSNGGEYGTAAKWPNRPVRKTGTRHAAGGWGVVTGRSRAGRVYKTRVRYGTIYDRYEVAGLCQGYLRYEPTAETGSMTAVRVARPNYHRCLGVRGDRWFRSRSDGTPYSVSWGVGAGGFVGVSLSVSKQYGSSSHKIGYQFARDRGRMCGRNTAPAVSGKVMQKRW